MNSIFFYDWFRQYLTKDIISEMSISRNKAEEKVASVADNIYLHLFKIQAYHHQKRETIEHWIGEIYHWMNKVHSIKLKNNKRISLKDVKLWMETGGDPVTLNNYSIRVKIFLNELIHIKHPPYPKPDKDFIVNEESAKSYMKVLNQLLWFMSDENKLDHVDYDELYNCICSGFDIHL